VTLLVLAVLLYARQPPRSIDICCLPSPQQQTCRTLLQWANGTEKQTDRQTDGQTDTVPLNRPCSAWKMKIRTLKNQDPCFNFYKHIYALLHKYHHHHLFAQYAEMNSKIYAMCRTERLTVLALTTARRYRIELS